MKDELAVICANVQYKNNCNDEVWKLVNAIYGSDKADKICLALEDKDVCLNCEYYDTTFPSGVERDEPQCLNQHSCYCGQHVTRDYSCKFFEPTDAIRDTIHKIKSPLGSNFETHKTEDGFVHVHKRAKNLSVTDTIRPEIDMTKVWVEPNNKFSELIYSVPAEYTLSLYTGGGDKLPTCTLCGSIMHCFSSCSNKNCIQYKGLK